MSVRRTGAPTSLRSGGGLPDPALIFIIVSCTGKLVLGEEAIPLCSTDFFSSGDLRQGVLERWADPPRGLHAGAEKAERPPRSACRGCLVPRCRSGSLGEGSRGHRPREWQPLQEPRPPRLANCQAGRGGPRT